MGGSHDTYDFKTHKNLFNQQHVLFYGRHRMLLDTYVLIFILEPEPETMRILRGRLKNEIQLYNFVKDLFYLQLASLNANEM